MEDITNRFGFKGFVDSRIGGRKENQDSYGFADTPLGLLVVVCDGMGGGPAGKTASELATSTIVSVVRSCKPQDHPERILQKAVESANSALLGAISANPSLQGMGTTCVALLANKKYAYIVHVGDSRCYVLREGKVTFRTADHSYVAEMVRKGELTEEQARLSNRSNVITRAIGIRPTVEAEVDKVGIKIGDRFALMTDGIWGALPEVHLISSLCSDDELPLVVSELADRIDAMGHNNGGQHDNMTLAVVDFPNSSKQTAVNVPASNTEDDDYSLTEYAPNPRKSHLLWILACLLVFSLGINAYLCISSLLNKSEKEPQATQTFKENPWKKIDSLNNEIERLNREKSQLRESSENGRDVTTVNEVSNEVKRQPSSSDKKDEPSAGSFQLVDKQKFLQKAIDNLAKLDTLGTSGIKETGKKRDNLLKQIKSNRSQLRNNICSNLNDAAKVCSEAERSKVIDLHDRIKNNNKIINVDSEGRPSKDAKVEIKTFMDQIKGLNK